MELSLDTPAKNTWCPGCGNFGILTAAKSAFKELIESDEIKHENIVICGGIGCHGKIFDYIKVNSFYSIHGRVPPVVSGIKLANPNLRVIGFAGDGDAYDEGIDHLIHAARRNIDVTLIIHNNHVFALTTGQTTPTSPLGFVSKSTPRGSIEPSLNPIALMLVCGATFVARGFSGRSSHLKDLIKEGIRHRGFSFIDILQPCVTFYNTFKFYGERVYDLNQEKHDFRDFKSAMEKAYEWGDRIPIGIFYKVEKDTFNELVLHKRILVDEKEIPLIGQTLKTHI